MLRLQITPLRLLLMIPAYRSQPRLVSLKLKDNGAFTRQETTKIQISKRKDNFCCSRKRPLLPKRAVTSIPLVLAAENSCKSGV